MARKKIKIDESMCVGCGLCVSACREGAIGLVNGKARLLREDYCDGLGSCLPACPMGAITFEERKAAFGKTAKAKTDAVKREPEAKVFAFPGACSKGIERGSRCNTAGTQAASAQTHLNQWPVQLKLVPPNAPYFKNANLLVAVDCAAYAYGGFHSEYMKNHITVIGCPKLDNCDYSEKLTAILKTGNIKSVTVVRMEVPCCGGIEHAVKTALQNSGKMISLRVATISTDGKIIKN